VSDAFGEWLADREVDQPFFGFCWSIEPHVPYDPPGEPVFRDPQYDGPVDGSRESLTAVETAEDLEHLRALYDEEIRYNDACLGDLVGTLRDEGEYEETLLVVVGDHGDAFEEHGRLTHGHAPHEELVDLYATLLEHATDRSLRDAPGPVAGHSNAAALEGAPINGHQRAFFETRSYDMERAFRGVRTPDWKYIEIEDPSKSVTAMLAAVRYAVRKGILLEVLRNPGYYWRRYRYDETTQLYDLGTDPDERENLANKRPDVLDELETAMNAWLDSCEDYHRDSQEGSDEGEIDDRTQQQLRELGYVD